MPNRPWRKCATCEWFIADTGKDGWLCINLAIQRVISTGDSNVIRVIYENGCSEWKSAELETCVMCEWFFPFGDREKGVCNHSMSQPRNYISRSGACEHFRRKDAD